MFIKNSVHSIVQRPVSDNSWSLPDLAHKCALRFLFSYFVNCYCSIARCKNSSRLPYPIWFTTHLPFAPPHIFSSWIRLAVSRETLDAIRRHWWSLLIILKISRDQIKCTPIRTNGLCASALYDPRRSPRNRPKTVRQTNDSTVNFLLLLFSGRYFVILLVFGEAETSSAEEQLVEE